VTTRRYPRSLCEAWPQHYAWRGVVSHHKRPLAHRVWDCIFVSLLAIAAAVVMFTFLGR
jgi:hypothetical protein